MTDKKEEKKKEEKNPEPNYMETKFKGMPLIKKPEKPREQEVG